MVPYYLTMRHGLTGWTRFTLVLTTDAVQNDRAAHADSVIDR